MTTLEKAARAIAKVRGIGPATDLVSDDFIWRCYDKESAFAEARAAIEALKNPSLALIREGEEVYCAAARDNVATVWNTMLDWILKEEV